MSAWEACINGSVLYIMVLIKRKELHRRSAQELFFKLFFTDAISITQSPSLIGTITLCVHAVLPLRGVDY